MNKKLIITILLISSLLVISCSKSSDDSDAKKKLGLVALYIKSKSSAVAVTGTKKQVTQASTAKSAATTASKGAAKAAQVKTKSVGFFNSYENKAIANVIRKTLKGSFAKKFDKFINKYQSIQTNLTCTGDGCDGEGTATITGSETCGKGGTYTMNSLVFSATADGTMTMTGGTITYTNCKNEVLDVLNYPTKNIITITSGTLTPRGSAKYVISDDGNSVTSVEDMTINGTMSVSGVDLTLTDLRNVTSLTEVTSTADTDFYYIGADGTKLDKTAILTNYTDEDGATYKDIDYTKVYGVATKVTANGTLTTSGTLSGDTVAFTGTFDSKVATSSVLCTKNFGSMTDDDWASTTVCTYTVN